MSAIPMLQPRLHGFIYFIGNREHDFVKIGFTAGHPKRRLNALQTGCPFKLETMFVMDGDQPLEREMHRLCAQDQLHGEWFRLSGKPTYIIDNFRWFYQKIDGTDGSVRYVA